MRLRIIEGGSYIKDGITYRINENYRHDGSQLDKLIDIYKLVLDEYTSVTAFRIDLSIKSEHRDSYTPDTKIITKFFQSLKRRKYKVHHRDGTVSHRQYPFKYVWKKENGTEKGLHYHVMFFFKLRDVNKILINESKVYCAINAIWKKQTQGRGVIQLITHRQSSQEQIEYELVAKPNQRDAQTHYCDFLFSDNSIDQRRDDEWIRIRNDTSSRMSFFHWYSYLSKYSKAGSDEKIQVTGHKRNFGTGDFKPKPA